MPNSYESAWRERDHNSMTAMVVGGTHQDLSALCDRLSTQQGVSLLAYDTPCDMLANIPARAMNLLVIHSPEDLVELSRTLRWAKRNHPRCVLAVVSDEPAAELDARQHGAMYFQGDVDPWQWTGLLESAQQLQHSA
ncbi:MAG: hypothetical protein HN909_08020 [Phycisphaerales bacterium]|jgi:hypothetical protein|nr:hypothetical protein [Phycisphaerales bacterium]MBT7171702.1 hypothetical protein [Phycisphaerales bacterium]